MALPQDIITNIERRYKSCNGDLQQKEILKFLKDKLNNGISPEDVFQYAENTHLYIYPDRIFAISADTISGIGLFLSKSKDKVKQNLASKFFKLAADRDNVLGCRNYAVCKLYGKNGEGESISEALEYAEKAVKITPNYHDFKKTYAMALNANGSNYLAFMAMIEFLKFHIENKTKEDQSLVDEKINFCNGIISTIFPDPNQNTCSNKISKAELEKLSKLIKKYATNFSQNSTSYETHNEICLCAGKIYEKLNKDSKAWLIYCQAKNKDEKYYSQVVDARKKLLKKFITSQFDKLIEDNDRRDGDNSEQVHQEGLKTYSKLARGKIPVSRLFNLPSKNRLEDSLVLPEGKTLDLNFLKHWRSDHKFFHSINKVAFDEQYFKAEELIGNSTKEKKEKIKSSSEDVKNQSSNSDLESELKKLEKFKRQLDSNYHLNAAGPRKIFRRHKAEVRFFDPKRLKRQQVIEKLKNLTLKIVDHRFFVNDDSLTPPMPIILPGVSSRMLITAERVFQEAVTALSGGAEAILGIPRHKEEEYYHYKDGVKCKGSYWLGPTERYQAGETEILAKHRTSPKMQRRGTSYMPQLKNYNTEIDFLKRLIGDKPQNEKKIASYLIRYSKNHTPVTIEELIKLNSYADEADVDRFNRIAFLVMEKEQAQWHSATAENYQLGMSVAQARALIMLEAGHLKFEEVFKNDALFGVYSRIGITASIKEVEKACQRIDKLYTDFVLNKNPDASMQFFKSQIKEKQKRTVVLTREQARQDLLTVYGGEGDSDGEGYDSDLDFSETSSANSL